MMASSFRLLTAIMALSLPITVTAFEVRQYSTEQCSGLVTTKNVTVTDGCMTDNVGEMAGIINRWSDEDDNGLVLATFSGSECCHANLIAAYGWEVQCVEVSSEVGSWRVLDPNKPDEGKSGDYYSCG
ncbi:hypothetical protein G7Z17_g11938 [Cylindrodendrum hubeiense]|uniref:Uncharacterized protein n=1 Tax=Cylindrodendrum hubeiense TaxID=595255 RepID=A0A9P5H2Z6_9HYPO|nr:hypothetical protein G7Z17_g11938 [Cylindrodendrum hubeiense]